MTVFYFVRHAVTPHTGKKLSGRMNGISLDDEGRGQAVAVADRLSKVPFKAVYSSPIDRTMETAREIADRHDLDVRRARGLIEVEYGKWTDRSLKVLMRTKLWPKVQRWPSAVRFPEGESIREVQHRAVTEVERLVEEHPREVLCCVSHGDVIKLIFAHYLGVHIDLFQRIVIAPASFSVLGVGDDRPVVLALNSAAPAPGMA
jgi:probable phosphomutase (TIGR03848 family)